MAVPEQIPLVDYVADGTAKKFDVPFDYDMQEDLHLFVDGVAPTIDKYFFQDNAFNFYIAPTVGQKVRIERITPKKRDTDYDLHTNTIRPKALNNDFDRIWFAIQESYEDFDELSIQLQNEIITRIQADEEILAKLAQETADRILGDTTVSNDLKNYIDQMIALIIGDPSFSGINADKVNDGNQTQDQINLYGGKTYDMPVGGYPLNARVLLDNGDIVQSTIPNNTNNPNSDMTGWVSIYNQLKVDTMFDNYEIVPPEKLNSYVKRAPIQAILKTDGTDETVNFLAYLAKAKELNVPIVLPSGTILISDTALIDFTVNMSGSGRDRTILRFRNTTLNKPLIAMVRGATKSVFKDITFQEETLFSSIGLQMKDSFTDVGAPLWKCAFYNCEWLGFNWALNLTTNNPLLGTSHAHCSENLFIHCKFSANKRWIYNQNCQAVNNMFLKCEVENSDTSYLNGQTITDNGFEFLVDEAGGGFVIEGGSYIGRGRICGWKYPTGGTNLFSGSGTFAGHDMRLECRSNAIPHYGCLFEEITGGQTGVSMHYDINVSNMKTVNQGGVTLDLLRFSGRMSAYFNNVSPVGGFGLLNVRHYPTLGRSATDSTGSLASVVMDCCSLVRYIKDTSSPFGTYNANHTGSVEFRGTRSTSPNSTFVNDTQGWAVMTGGGDINQLPFQYSNVRAFSNLVYNRDWTSSGLPAASQLKVRMPYGGRPMKLFCYKNPTNLATDHTFTLYLVKDNANWADPLNFNLASDAFSVAVTPSSLNNAGMFEVSVRVPTSTLGSPLISGQGSWLEGRMLIVNNGTTAFSGFIGVEYG